MTPTAIHFWYTRSIPRDLGNVGQRNCPSFEAASVGFEVGSQDWKHYTLSHSATAPHIEFNQAYITAIMNFALYLLW